MSGALAYVYGVRVVKQDVSIADALIPGRIKHDPGPRHPQVAVASPEHPRPASVTADAGGDAQQDPAAADVLARAQAAAQAARYRL